MSLEKNYLSKIKSEIIIRKISKILHFLKNLLIFNKNGNFKISLKLIKKF